MDKLIARLQSLPSDPLEVVLFVLAMIGAVYALSEVMYIAWCIIRNIRAGL